MEYLIGLDDTDDISSRGTGFRARQLGRWLQWHGFARVNGITRHQLSDAEEISKTSKNSAACLHVRLDVNDLDRLQRCLVDFLNLVAAPTADPGLCLAQAGSIPSAVRRFGRRCKEGVVELPEAVKTARIAGFRMAASGALGFGRIGAVAAVGLRASGEDGRFIWLPGLRSLKGVKSLMELSNRCGIGAASSLEGVLLEPEARIQLDGWIRPLLRGGRPTLYVEQVEGNVDYGWKLLDKRRVKQLDE